MDITDLDDTINFLLAIDNFCWQIIGKHIFLKHEYAIDYIEDNFKSIDDIIYSHNDYVIEEYKVKNPENVKILLKEIFEFKNKISLEYLKKIMSGEMATHLWSKYNNDIVVWLQGLDRRNRSIVFNNLER